MNLQERLYQIRKIFGKLLGIFKTNYEKYVIMYKYKIGSDNMTDKFVINYINKKIQESKDENFIRYTFYELRVKNNLSEEDLDTFFRINKDYFENKGYNVYFTGAKFKYKDADMIVQDNELMIAVKE